MQPNEIERKSFEIIDYEAGNHGLPKDQWTIIQRIIHTSADFNYVHSVKFHENAIQSGIHAIRTGQPIFTDTQMAMAGIRKSSLVQYGCNVSCLIGHETVVQNALKTQTTRASAAVDYAADMMNGGIYAIGNAPTALLRLLELVKQNKATPALIIGLPVGFVNAAESKEALLTCKIPFITNIGRKGGSNIVAAVINALIKMV
ncbi:MAG: precorrin-8X methylmutase [Candidatus Magnetoglobus multicellularis str. Araruama]|uniref:Precorrin-8X methylmutase n=1 Tax=Candidatus Magnetoglobus multicellularis str. Araruama TaxID=890399 RepID=A0A1V1P500_9BACT|nr:MAG: precorrin-8X methylmutase [Candidatus Magnetoglobus multicellularis str. Araruama]